MRRAIRKGHPKDIFDVAIGKGENISTDSDYYSSTKEIARTIRLSKKAKKKRTLVEAAYLIRSESAAVQ